MIICFKLLKIIKVVKVVRIIVIIVLFIWNVFFNVFVIVLDWIVLKIKLNDIVIKIVNMMLSYLILRFFWI